MDNIEYKGVWWLPDNPDHKVSGFLTFSQEKGGKLELIGSFKEIFSDPFGQVDNYPIILGQTTDGKYITLQNCFETHYSFTTGMTQESTVLVHFVYTDIHISKEDDFRFNKVQAKFTYLYNWAGVTGISYKLYEDNHKIQVAYETPEDILIPIEDGKIKITFGASIKTNFDFAIINEKTSLFIECNENKDFHEISQNYLFPLQSLICLGTTKPNFVEELYFFHTDYPETPISVYYAQRFYKAKDKDFLHNPDMLFTLLDIYDDLETRINIWIALTKEIDSVLHLLNRVRIASDMFLELKFLSISQALETYHRTQKENLFMPKYEHDAMIKEIVDSVPEQHKKFVGDRIGNNEKSLLAKLLDILQEKNDIILPLVHDIEAFAKITRDSRNYYTHYGKSKKKCRSQDFI